MTSSSHIKLFRHIAAIMLLVVFTVGNTPKAAFHFLFADHQDETYMAFEGDHIKTTGKKCDILDLVCSLPFQSTAYTQLFQHSTGRDLQPVNHENNISFAFHDEFSLRGPPPGLNFSRI